jgi:hypothetical protein
MFFDKYTGNGGYPLAGVREGLNNMVAISYLAGGGDGWYH